MRVIGPLAATVLFFVDPAYTYYFSALVLTLSFVIGIFLLKLLRVYENVHPLFDCKSCGHQLVYGDAFCQYCGNSVS